MIDGKFGGFRFEGTNIIEEDYLGYAAIQIFADKVGVNDGKAWERFWKSYNAKRQNALQKAIEQHWDAQMRGFNHGNKPAQSSNQAD